jgi:hypothetical protein
MANNGDLRLSIDHPRQGTLASSASSSKDGMRWNLPYRECGAYNKAFRQQVEQELKVLKRDTFRK